MRVVLAAVLLTGCTGSVGSEGPVVPFVARDPGPVPAWFGEGGRYDEEPAPSGLRPCRQQDLTLVPELIAPTTLRTTISSSTDCALPGGRLTARVVGDPELAGDVDTPSRALRPGGVTNHFTAWGSWCGSGDVRLRFEVGGAAWTTPVLDRTPPCRAGDGPVRPTPWRAVSYDPTPPPRAPHDDLDQSVDGFRTVDGVVHVELVLTNRTGEDVPLDPCPVVTMTAGEGGTGVSARHRLNCEDAPAAVPAGEAVRFALELPLGDAFGDPPTTLVPEPDQDHQGYGFAARLETVSSTEQEHEDTGLPVRVAR